MSREFDLDEILSFPTPIIEKYLEGYHIILAPQNPNWIVLNDEEYNMFKYLREGQSLRTSLENYYSKYCGDEEECIRILTSLLEQINDVDFTSDATVSEEEPIEKITKKVHIGTTNGCNMRCKHCYMAAGKNPLETIDLDKTVQIIKGLNKIYGNLEIVVSGGEPLTYKNIYSLLEQIKDNYIILFTNGSLITETNAAIIAECCNEVQISFEGITPECYGLVRDIEKYEAVLNALRLLKEHNVKIVLAVTLLPDTMFDIQKNLIGFVKSLDYNNIEVRINDDIEISGNAESMEITKQSKINSNEIVIQMIRELDRIGCSIQNNDIRNTRFTNCGIGTSVVINYDGKVYPCHKFSDYSLSDSSSVEQIVKQFNTVNLQTSNNNILKCHNSLKQDGACPKCQGKGCVLIGNYYDEQLYIDCEYCDGTGYSRKTLSYKVDGMNIYDFLEQNIDTIIQSGISVSKKFDSTIRLLASLGLGHLVLNQQTNTLSGGENQRLKLSKALGESSTKIFGLDEPSKGLGRNEMISLVQVIYDNIERQGKTFIVSEHNPEFLALCSCVSELVSYNNIVRIKNRH